MSLVTFYLEQKPSGVSVHSFVRGCVCVCVEPFIASATMNHTLNERTHHNLHFQMAGITPLQRAVPAGMTALQIACAVSVGLACPAATGLNISQKKPPENCAWVVDPIAESIAVVSGSWCVGSCLGFG